MVTMAAPAADHLALARGADVHPAADRGEDLRIPAALWPARRARGRSRRVAGRVHGAGGDGGEQFMGAGLAQRGFGGGDIFARRIDGGLAGLQAGDRVVLGLLAHNSLLGQRDGAAGVGLLMVVVGLRLGERGLGRLDHAPRR